MEGVMYDVYIAEAMIENNYQDFDTPQKKESYIHKIFNRHNVTQAQWDSSLSWYSDRIDVYLRMNDSVKARLQREQKSLEKKLNDEYTHEQSSTLRFLSASYIPRFYTFAASVSDGFRFRLDSAEISTRIVENEFSFRFNAIGIPSDGSTEFRSTLILEYADTTLYQSVDIVRNDAYRLSASKYIADDTLRSISGFVRLQPKNGYVRNIQLYNIALGNEFENKSKEAISQEPSPSTGDTEPTSLQKVDSVR